MASPPPGWYDDPARSGRLRYWDGASWTDHLSDPLPTSEQPAPRGTVVEEEPAPTSSFWPFGGPADSQTRPLDQVEPPQTQVHPERTEHLEQRDPARPGGRSGPSEPAPMPPAAPREQPPRPAEGSSPGGAHRHLPSTVTHSAPGSAAVPSAGPRASDGAPLAPWWRRLIAWVVDVALVIAAGFLPSMVILATRIDQLESYTRAVEAATLGDSALPTAPPGLIGALTACIVLTTLLYFLYEVFGLARFGTTVGRRLMGIRVRTPGSAGNLSIEGASRRAGVKVAGQIATGVPLLANLGLLFTLMDVGRGVMDRERRTLHDLAGATDVVLVPKPTAIGSTPGGSRPYDAGLSPSSAQEQQHRSA